MTGKIIKMLIKYKMFIFLCHLPRSIKKFGEGCWGPNVLFVLATVHLVQNIHCHHSQLPGASLSLTWEIGNVGWHGNINIIITVGGPLEGLLRHDSQNCWTLLLTRNPPVLKFWESGPYDDGCWYRNICLMIMWLLNSDFSCIMMIKCWSWTLQLR